MSVTNLVKTETITTKRVVKGRHELSNSSEVEIAFTYHCGDIDIKFACDAAPWTMSKHDMQELICVLQEITDAMGDEE